MHLPVKDAARLLGVTEKAIYQWVDLRGLPAHQINEQMRFHLTEIVEWATANKLTVDSAMLAQFSEQGIVIPSLDEALRVGGIQYRVPGADRPTVLRNVTELLPLTNVNEREEVLELLYARENLGTTSVGQGIAIPHARFPLVCGVRAPLVMLCFLQTPIDFAALDGLPVNILFLLLSPTPRIHLQMLSRLAGALHDQEFLRAIKTQSDAETIISCAKRLNTGAQGETSPPR